MEAWLGVEGGCDAGLKGGFVDVEADADADVDVGADAEADIIYGEESILPNE